MPASRNETPLLLISQSMLAWLLAIITAYILIDLIAPRRTGYLYDANGEIFRQIFWFRVFGMFVFIATVYLILKTPGTLAADTMKVLVIILGSVLLLSLAVFLTGGFIDSPFSSAVAMYIGFFILLSRRRVFPKTNLALIALTVLLLAMPYLYLYHYRDDYPSMHIIVWHSTPLVTGGRLAISMLLLLVAGWVGARVSGEASKLRD